MRLIVHRSFDRMQMKYPSECAQRVEIKKKYVGTPQTTSTYEIENLKIQTKQNTFSCKYFYIYKY